MSLREKTVSGFLWNTLSSSASMIIEFTTGIVLARLLTPRDFGLVGMLAIFIGLSNLIINSGFSQALIRKTDCTQEDYSTTFFFNIITGGFLFVCMYASAYWVGVFYEEEQLELILKVLAIGVFFSAFAVVQRAQLVQRIEFKKLSYVSILASLISGVVAILAALKGFGVWALVVKNVLNIFVTTVLLWFINKWLPKFVFSRKSFKDLFGFGFNLLISGFIANLFTNLYSVVIGKYFSPASLGYFNQAERFRTLPSQNLTTIFSTVAYPVLSKVQDDKKRLRSAFSSLLSIAAMLVIQSMFGLMAVSEEVIILAIGEEWRPSVPLLNILCCFGIFVPLNSLNANILNVVGRSDLYLRTQLFLQSTKIFVVIAGILFGIEALAISIVVSSAVSYFVFVKYAAQHTNYGIKDQIKDILPHVLIGIAMMIILTLFGNILAFSMWIMLLLKLFLGAIWVLFIYEFIQNPAYLQLKEQLIQKLRQRS